MKLCLSLQGQKESCYPELMAVIITSQLGPDMIWAAYRIPIGVLKAYFPLEYHKHSDHSVMSDFTTGSLSDWPAVSVSEINNNNNPWFTENGYILLIIVS